MRTTIGVIGVANEGVRIGLIRSLNVGVWVGSWWLDDVVSDGDSTSVDIVARALVALNLCFGCAFTWPLVFEFVDLHCHRWSWFSRACPWCRLDGPKVV